MIHKQRFLTNEEWEKYDQIIASVKEQTEGYLPNEICAKPFISPPLINPSVMIVGYNPGEKGTNAKVWNDPHDPSKYRWAIGELLNPKDRFLRLFSRCFLIEDWSELVQPNQIDLVWTNLYPFPVFRKIFVHENVALQIKHLSFSLSFLGCLASKTGEIKWCCGVT